ncbi:MAG: hypothetical protein JO362_16355 [Streptomycetaceae bacterium]|nr:hypothetical protein [Streptomycetaceae bacterium]
MTATEEEIEPGFIHGTVNGYTLVVPKEWRKIPVRKGTDQAIKRILDEAFAHYSRDEIVQQRRDVEMRLRDVIKNARQNAGVDLFLPIRTQNKDMLASFLISYAEFGRLDAPSAQAVLGHVKTTLDNANWIELAGVRGMRTERVCPPDRDRDINFASRRVEYLLPVPNTADSWLVASYSTLGDGDPESELSKLFCDLFDAIMLTFRWTYREDQT